MFSSLCMLSGNLTRRLASEDAYVLFDQRGRGSGGSDRGHSYQEGNEVMRSEEAEHPVYRE